MRQFRASYVTVCQQLLVLLVVIAALVPAASVVSMELFDDESTPARQPRDPNSAAQPLVLQQMSATPDVLPAGEVEATVTTVALTQSTSSLVAGRAVAQKGGVLSPTLAADGYAGVGVTWSPADTVEEEALAIEVRTQTEGGWSAWESVDYHAEHAPDPGTPEAESARPGTDLVFVGHVDSVQVRVNGDLPRDLTVALTSPGIPEATTVAAPALRPEAATGKAGVANAEPTDEGDALKLAAAAYTPRPKIFSREQWGADESLRERDALSYYEVHAGFVHHTVNANDYTRSEVPGIIRSIYAYHVRSRGWSDIGYNFLIDRFGRIWEGRYGGIDRPVVGAHTLGYNSYSFAASAIGNYELVRPPAAMVNAFGVLMGWKLSLHGVDPMGKATLDGDRFEAINGHRDAGSTACPGRYLYARLDDIRTLARQAQVGWSGRERESDLAGSPAPDLFVRRASDGRGFVLPYDAGKGRFGARIDTGANFARSDVVIQAGDWDRDGDGDLITRSARNGNLYLRVGDGEGHFAGGVKIAEGFADVELLAAVADVTGDGYPDLMGQPPGAALRIYPGASTDGFLKSYPAYNAITAADHIGIGRMTADGAPDSLFRIGDRLVVYRGNGPGGLVFGPRELKRDVGAYDWLVGVSDVGLTGHADLIGRDGATGQWLLFAGANRGFADPVVIGTGALEYDLVAD